MTKVLKKWVIDVVPPRKAEAVIEPAIYKGHLCDDTKMPFVGEFISESLEFVLDSNSDPVMELVKAGAVVNKFRYEPRTVGYIKSEYVVSGPSYAVPAKINRQDLFKQVLPVNLSRNHITRSGNNIF